MSGTLIDSCVQRRAAHALGLRRRLNSSTLLCLLLKIRHCLSSRKAAAPVTKASASWRRLLRNIT